MLLLLLRLFLGELCVIELFCVVFSLTGVRKTLLRGLRAAEHGRVGDLPLRYCCTVDRNVGIRVVVTPGGSFVFL